MRLEPNHVTELLNSPIRDRCGVKITVGQFDNSGDSLCYNSSYADYSKPYLILDDDDTRYSYQTWTGNGLHGDGKQAIMSDNQEYLPISFVSSVISDSIGNFSTPPYIRFEFTELRTIGGITLMFGNMGRVIPKEINIITYNGDVQVTNQIFTNISLTFIAELFAVNIDKIQINFTKTLEPRQAVCINHILLGVGYEFGINDIITYTLEHSGDSISTEFPSLKLSFSVKNEDGYFDPTSQNNRMHFFSQSNFVEAQFIMLDWTRTDNYWISIPLAKLKLDTWAVDGIIAKFTAVPNAEKIKDLYIEKPPVYQFNPVKTLSNRLAEVKSDIGFTDPVYIPRDFNDIICIVPFSSHTKASDAIQLLSNFGGYSLQYYGGFGNEYGACLGIQESYSESNFDLTSINQPSTPYSSVENIGENAKHEYTTWERDFFRGDGKQIILPDSGTYLNNGYVSSDLVDSTTDSISVLFTAPNNTLQSLESLYIDFGDIIPEQLDEYVNEGTVESPAWRFMASVYPTQSKQVLWAGGTRISQFRIDLKNGSTNSMLNRRFHILNIEPSFTSAFALTTSNIFYPIKISSKQQYSTISSNFIRIITNYTEEKITNIEMTSVGTYKIPISPCSNIRFQWAGDESGSGSDVIYYAYYDYISFEVRDMGTFTRLAWDIYGQKQVFIDNFVSRTIGDTGNNLPFENQLYDSFSFPDYPDNDTVERVLDKTEQWADENVEIEVTLMAHPEVEVGDYISLWDGSSGWVKKRILKDGRDTFTIRRKLSNGLGTT